MSEKQAEKKDKKLLDALQEEAKEIEKRAESYQGQHLTQDDKDDMYLKIMERLEEMGELEKDEEKESEATGTDGAVVMPMPKKKPVKKPLWRQIVKCAGILLVAGSVVFATSLISEGNRMYWMEKWQSLFPGSNTAIANNGDDRIYSDLTEKEAKAKVEEQFGIPIPEFLYLPSETIFTGVTIGSDKQVIKFDYMSHDNMIYLSITGNEEDASESIIPQDKADNIISIDTKQGVVKISLIEDKSGANGTTIYRGQWIYSNYRYELCGVIEKEEMIRILEKIKFYV